MARKPKLRVSYVDDAQYLLRLENAIMRDGSRPLEWRREMAGRVKELAVDFLQAPARVKPQVSSAGASQGASQVRSARGK